MHALWAGPARQLDAHLAISNGPVGMHAVWPWLPSGTCMEHVVRAWSMRCVHGACGTCMEHAGPVELQSGRAVEGWPVTRQHLMLAPACTSPNHRCAGRQALGSRSHVTSLSPLSLACMCVCPSTKNVYMCACAHELEVEGFGSRCQLTHAYMRAFMAMEACRVP